MSFLSGRGADRGIKQPVYFVGAGPGDPELLTVKASRLLREADLVVYTGSLVPRQLVSGLSAKVVDSSSLSLDQILELVGSNARAGRRVVRLHTGDPCLYSAIIEQIFELRREGIECIVVPGVSSGFAAAAALGLELTIPGISQTVIISRIGGRTAVPEKEDISRLAAIRATMLLYLSVGYIDRLVAKLIEGGYPDSTPVAVVEKVSWPEERIVTGTLKDIVHRVHELNIRKTAIILVGDVLRAASTGDFDRSMLYDPSFSHACRSASSGVASEDHAGGDLSSDEGPVEGHGDDNQTSGLIETSIQPSGSYNHSLNSTLDTTAPHDYKPMPLTVFYITQGGRYQAERISSFFPEVEILPFKEIKRHNALDKAWKKGRGIVFVMASGIAVRTIAPYITRKDKDPALVVMDETGTNVISLLSGHLGGANHLAETLALLLKARPVITTASDNLGLVSLDIWTDRNGLVASSKRAMTVAQTRLVENKGLTVFSDINISSYPNGLIPVSVPQKADIIISYIVYSRIQPLLYLYPKVLCLGTGCHKDADPELFRESALNFMTSHGYAVKSIACLATIDLKKSERAILEFAEYLGVEIKYYSASELNSVPVSHGSDMVFRAVGTRAVAEPAAILASNTPEGPGKLLITKEKRGDATFALAMRKLTL